MGRRIALGARRGQRWKLVLAVLTTAVAFASGVGAASATTGSDEKKVQKFVDLCHSQGGTLLPDGPGALICGFGSTVIPFDDLADAERLCQGQLKGELFIETVENFYICSPRRV